MSLITVLSYLFYGKPEIIFIFTLLISLLHNDDEKELYKNSIFTIGIFTSVIIFSFLPIAALLLFELARIFNKGYKSLDKGLFTLVPIVTLVFASLSLKNVELNYLVYYFGISFFLISIESIRGSRDWPSLAAILYFAVGSNLTVLSYSTLWILITYLIFIVIGKLIKRQDIFFNYIGFSSLGMVSLSFSNEKVFSFIISSIAFEYLSRSKKVRPSLLQSIYIFSIILFSKSYFKSFEKLESIYPVLFLLLPLLCAQSLVARDKEHSSKKINSTKTLLAMIAYLIGVFVYAY